MDSAWLAQGSRAESFAFWTLVMLLAGLETLWPYRPLLLPAARRWLNHAVLLALNTLVNVLLFRGGLVIFAVWARDHAPLTATRAYALRFGLAFFALDLARYASHVAYHRSAALWRVHRVHHADLDFDVTTSFRFHPLENLLTTSFLFALIAVFGPPPAAVFAAEAAAMTADLCEHANLRLPAPLDRALRWVLITPNMHRLHHSVDIGEQNSNFGTVFPWWDRLFGTYRATGADGPVGLEALSPADSASIPKTLAAPFLKEF